MYTQQEVLEASREYFDGDDLAADVCTKYLLRNSNDEFLEKTPDDMHHRLAGEFARIEKKYPNPMSKDEIYELFRNFKDVVPQGSPMAAIGNDHQLQSLSNCFVIASPADSYGGILLADQEQVQIMKRRGGVGFDISPIRPQGTTTSNAARTTDGIGVFMERFSNSCREVAQKGRRGALMITIDCRHPEIETFINIKRDLAKITGANISIRFTDEFMKAVVKKEGFTLRWPVESKPSDAKITKDVWANEIWDKFIESAWAAAEPGALFWDTVTKNTPADIYSDFGFASESTNPCGELVLCPYDSCRLMVINLASFVRQPFSDCPIFEFGRLHEVAVKAQRLMDDLVDLELEAIDKILNKIKKDNQPDNVKQVEFDLWTKIRVKCEQGRRTGLGITALGDALAMMNLTYGSARSVKWTGKIYKALAVGAHTSSCILAEERGTFPIFDFNLEKDHTYLRRIMKACGPEVEEMWRSTGRRNIALTTTAPVGSGSTMTQTTSGIESSFLLKYKRRRKLVPGDNRKPDFVDEMGDKWQEYTVYHHNFKKWMDVTGEENVEDSPYWKATSNDVDWLRSVEIQAAAQKWIDHSLSKTCNLPSDATKELVSDAYLAAWKSGCKGFTVYRDGCRAGVLVSAEEKKQKEEKSAIKRPKSLPCDIRRLNVKGTEGLTESWLVLVGMRDGKPYEVFCGMAEQIEVPKKTKSGILIKNGKKAGVVTYNLEVPIGEDDEIIFRDVVNLFANPTQGAFTRTLSLALRHEIPIQFIVEQIQKEKSDDMFSFSKCLARVLKTYIPDGTKTAIKSCDHCGSSALAYLEGCVTCKSCGSSKCS